MSALGFGHPILPWRAPLRESKYPFNARASPSRPAEYASFEFSAHHGATAALARFHSRRSAGRLQGIGPTNPAAHDSPSATLAPWRTAKTTSTLRASRRDSTSASPQLYAKRAAPACDANAERRALLGSNSKRYAWVTVIIGHHDAGRV